MSLIEIENKWCVTWFNFASNVTKINWDLISHNSNITMKFINDNIDKTWDWCAISRNPNITMKIL